MATLYQKTYLSLVNYRNISLLAEALFLVFADGRKETSAMGQQTNSGKRGSANSRKRASASREQNHQRREHI